MAKYTKRADGRYATRVTTGKFKPDGSPVVKQFYGKTIRELEDKVAAFKVKLGQGFDVFGDDMKFGFYAEQWYEAKAPQRSIKTNDMYRGILNNHIEILAPMTLNKITSTHIQKQINTVADKPRTAEQTLLTISQIMQNAIRDRLIAFNPCDGISLPRKVKKEKRAFTEAEKRAIRNAKFTEQEAAFFLIMYGCGLRPAEMYALTWSDIDLKNREISVNKSLGFKNGMPVVQHPKTNAGIRVIPMPEIVFKALFDYRRTMCCPLLFPNVNGQYKTLKRYQYIFAQCKKKIEAELGHTSDFTQYTCRHNYCTQLYYSNISMKECMRLMGHTDSKMILQVYAHLDAEQEGTKAKINAINF